MSEREFLIFRLAAPMGAFGDIAVGERRATWDAPSKSGMLGLVAAALGTERSEAVAHQALDGGLGFAVRQDQAGRPLRDYHTAQAPRARAGKRWRTRREELHADDLNTVLSERIYRLEPIATVALWVKADGAPSLPVIDAALRRPRFTLYVGRKACPLGWPPRPRIVEASDVNAALVAYDAAEAASDHALWDFLPKPRTHAHRMVWIEAGEVADVAQGVKERRQRRDGLMNRSLWQFTDRTESRVAFAPATHGETAP